MTWVTDSAVPSSRSPGGGRQRAPGHVGVVVHVRLLAHSPAGSASMAAACCWPNPAPMRSLLGVLPPGGQRLDRVGVLRGWRLTPQWCVHLLPEGFRRGSFRAVRAMICASTTAPSARASGARFHVHVELLFDPRRGHDSRAAAGHRRVQLLPGHALVGDDPRGVHGDALCPSMVDAYPRSTQAAA